jgi:hypothetical protein
MPVSMLPVQRRSSAQIDGRVFDGQTVEKQVC